MTDDCPPLVPSALSNERKSSSWNFDHLHEEDQSENCKDFFSVLKKTVSKNVYFDEELAEERHPSKTINERATIRVDSSDLIRRCKHFLPLLTDANRNLLSKIKSGENVRIELDSDDEDHERTIEMNLMFCPNTDSSSESDDEQQIEPTILPVKKTTTSAVNIVEIDPLKKSEDHVNN